VTVKDSNGTTQGRDTVHVIKTSSQGLRRDLKRGTVFKGIRLIEDEEDSIECGRAGTQSAQDLLPQESLTATPVTLHANVALVCDPM